MPGAAPASTGAALPHAADRCLPSLGLWIHSAERSVATVACRGHPFARRPPSVARSSSFFDSSLQLAERSDSISERSGTIDELKETLCECFGMSCECSGTIDELKETLEAAAARRRRACGSRSRVLESGRERIEGFESALAGSELSGR